MYMKSTGGNQMYRHLAIVAVILLTLSACNKDKTQQVEHATPQQNASLSHAIATQHEAAAVEETAHQVTPVAQPQEAVVVDTQKSAAAEGTDVQAQDIAIDQAQPATETVIYTTSIVSVQLENKFGPVLIPHQLHVEMYSCATCHGEGVPGKIDKTKKQFHSTCRGCHAEIKAGPTKCGSCHQRK